MTEQKFRKFKANERKTMRDEMKQLRAFNEKRAKEKEKGEEFSSETDGSS